MTEARDERREQFPTVEQFVLLPQDLALLCFLSVALGFLLRLFGFAFGALLGFDRLAFLASGFLGCAALVFETLTLGSELRLFCFACLPGFPLFFLTSGAGLPFLLFDAHPGGALFFLDLAARLRLGSKARGFGLRDLCALAFQLGALGCDLGLFFLTLRPGFRLNPLLLCAGFGVLLVFDALLFLLDLRVDRIFESN